MTTRNMAIIGVAVLAIVGAGLLLQRNSKRKPHESSSLNSLSVQQQKALKENELTSTTPDSGPHDTHSAISKERNVQQPEQNTHTQTLAQGMTLLKIELPKPFPGGTPKDIRSANLEPETVGKYREPVPIPEGAILLSKGCKVTSSDTEPIIGDLTLVTDDIKEHDAGNYVELGPSVQWVQIDLGKEKQIYAACLWHYHGEARVYRDVICQVSNDKDFIEGVQTVFNNDHDNSSKLGTGKDKEYIESNKGRPFAISGVKARYVRLYSRGSNANEMNHYTEVEIYGKEI